MADVHVMWHSIDRSVPVINCYSMSLIWHFFVQNHVAIGRTIDTLQDLLHQSLNKHEIEMAYLMFESLTNHTYNYYCILCGFHPVILIWDGIRKAAFKYAGILWNKSAFVFYIISGMKQSHEWNNKRQIITIFVIIFVINLHDFVTCSIFCRNSNYLFIIHS